MKKEDITFQEKLNELKLDILHPKSKEIVFVFLEGSSDIKLFRKLFDLEKCKVELIPGGKIKVEECVTLMLGLHLLIIGIRDADFIHLDKINYTIQNIFLTDYHDIEMTIISQNKIFSSVMFEFTDLDEKKHIEIRDCIFKTIKFIQLLRLLNERENLEFNFEKIGFADLIDFDKFEINENEFLDRLIMRSPNAKLKNIKIIKEKIKLYNETFKENFQLCNGHDFMKTLCSYFRHRGKQISKENLESFFRIAFTLNEYKCTYLYNLTLSWAKKNNCDLYV